jgi:hypothetical protein
MGRLIDEDILIGSIPDLSVFEEEDFCTSDMIHLIEDTPTIEAIPKDQYETRLKADMVAMLTELQTEIEELDLKDSFLDYQRGAEETREYIANLIQQKIDALRGKA